MGNIYEQLVVCILNYHAIYLVNPKPQNTPFVQHLYVSGNFISATFLLKLFGLTNWALCPMTTAFLKRILVLSDSGWTGNTTQTTFLMVFWHLDHQDQMVRRSAEEALTMNNDTFLKII